MTKEELKKFDIAYYEGTPVISDEEYDRIKEEYNKNNPNDMYTFEEVGEEDMTQSTFEKVSHGIYSMGSLDKLTTVEAVSKWTKNEYYPLRIDEKEDGASIKIIYDNGKFVQAITRGNGSAGFDITENVRLINFPKTIPIKNKVIVRGEVIFTYEDYKKAVDTITDKVSQSPRNLASGLLKRKDNLNALQYLTIRFYDIMNYNELKSYGSVLDTLYILFEDIYVTRTWIAYSYEDLMVIYNDYITTRRAKLNRDIDGLVLKTKTGDSIALKFPPTIKQTTIESVNWYVGVSGRITPVAVIKPIQLNGVTVTNVTLHNISYVEKYKIGMSVGVCRSGDVIPKIIDIYNDEGKKIELPKVCPVCGQSSSVEDKYLMCNNVDCVTKLSGRIIKWFNIHDVKGIGESTIISLIDNKIINSFVDFINIINGVHDNKIMSLEGIGLTTLVLLKDNINKTIRTDLIKFLSGLNITSVDHRIIERILEAMKMSTVTLEDFNEFIFSNDIESVKGIGDITLNKIRNGIKSRSNEIIELEKVITIQPYTINTESALSGKSFVITGTLSQPRKFFENKIKELGGKFNNTITKDLDYLICGESAGSKLDKAKSYGVTILTESQFNEIVG